MEIKAFQDLERALNELGSDRDVKLSVRRALKNKKTVQAVAFARSLAAKRTGRMAASINISTTLSRRQRKDRGWGGGKSPSERVEVLYLGAAPRGPAVLAEFGSRARQHRNGKSTGTMPAQPALRPAWEAFKYEILDEFSRELWIQIEKSAKRIARRQAKLIRESQR